MPAKIFQTQLENLFSKNSLADDRPGPSDSSTFPGWVWECDHEGNFIYCSPEVDQALGVQAVDFISQNLFKYRISPTSTETIRQFFQNSEQISCIGVSYKHQAGFYLPVNLYILGRWVNQEGQTIVRGFSQLQQLEELGIATSEALTPTMTSGSLTANRPDETKIPSEVDQAEELRRIKIASQLIIEMLEHLKGTSLEIQNAPSSRISTTTEQQMREDTTNGKGKSRYLFGKRVISVPQKTVTRLVHLLEWGKKLDLTDAEKGFLENNLYRPVSLFQKIRKHLGRRIILKAEKSWIRVMIQTEQDQPAKIIIQTKSDTEEVIEFDLVEYISDPLVLMPGLRYALQHPFQTKEELVRGVDFLIPV